MLKQKENECGENTTKEQYWAILEWLEMGSGENLKLITGQSTKDVRNVIAGLKTKKVDGYKSMAIFVNARCGNVGSSKWTTQNATSRFKSWLKKYTVTRRKLDDNSGPKYCLSDADIKKGLTTIEAKLNFDCPMFFRLDALFGGRQNVLPAFVMQSSDSQSTETTPALTQFIAARLS